MQGVGRIGHQLNLSPHGSGSLSNTWRGVTLIDVFHAWPAAASAAAACRGRIKLMSSYIISVIHTNRGHGTSIRTSAIAGRPPLVCMRARVTSIDRDRSHGC